MQERDWHERNRLADKLKDVESPEVFHASIGFDFVFARGKDGRKRCYCIELNGQETGTMGVEEIPDVQSFRALMSRIRNRINPERDRLQASINALRETLRSPDFNISEETRVRVSGKWNEHLRANPTFLHAYVNPPEIEELAEDKGRLPEVVPTELLPRIYKAGESTRSQHGFWVLKPRHGRGGDGVQIVTDATFKEFLHGEGTPAHERSIFASQWIAQEYVRALGADDASIRERGNPASLRLQVDFRYLSDGTIHIVGEECYQRVGPMSARLASPTDTLVHVVNKAKGATSADASDDEYALAQAAATKIMHNICAYYQKTKQHD